MHQLKIPLRCTLIPNRLQSSRAQDSRSETHLDVRFQLPFPAEGDRLGRSSDVGGAALGPKASVQYTLVLTLQLWLTVSSIQKNVWCHSCRRLSWTSATRWSGFNQVSLILVTNVLHDHGIDNTFASGHAENVDWRGSSVGLIVRDLFASSGVVR